MATEFATTEFTNEGGDAHGTCSVIDAGRGRHFFSGASSHAGLVLLANNGEQTLGIIDTVTNQLVATIAESGTTGHEVVASPDGKLAFVPVYGNSGVGRASVQSVRTCIQRSGRLKGDNSKTL